jgi:hypothetical protein
VDSGHLRGKCEAMGFHHLVERRYQACGHCLRRKYLDLDRLGRHVD